MQRKQFLVGAGLGIATGALAACSTYGKDPQVAEEPAVTTTGGVAAPAAVLAKVADVPVGGGVVVEQTVLTQPTAGDFKEFSATCTHAGCTVRDVAGGTINCPFHGSRFNLDGTVANGPATRSLESKPIQLQDDSIILS
ncbi:(2Fe-2S)-binding protein [Mycolicibacterium novocastrense]|uniref:ubiquinol-cytochrome c reductase iron-sulfur subunit n=1 Tax=Mycolicibacterium novocastrense TaxID=59813 RepID=UPI0007485E60|nr:Rieske (2Fe-2S) protein [Mycolicibacterium novocastrense]KUH65515.1 (2Fe-2S)-binding protein [Mycolicibacterium novocastrense]KUH77340.1 (2Fe-2S)-binding protein [Mycolicibacterium novocastrense]KUH77671.1 (2Fe-2S)-binding protein [Mycolicibacterium novocastrense]